MTTALWVLLIIALALLALNLLRVGVDAEYDGETLYLRVKAGPVKVSILPKKEKPAKPKKKKEKPPKAEKPPKEKKKLTASTLLKLARLALEAAGTFRRKLQTDLLRLHLRVGMNDPYDTAMTYGYLQAAIFSLHPLAERALNVKERDVYLAPDFTTSKIDARGRIILTIRIGQIALIALVMGWKALWTMLRQWRGKRLFKPKRTGKAKTEPRSAERTV